jgi:hypothetical protein
MRLPKVKIGGNKMKKTLLVFLIFIGLVGCQSNSVTEDFKIVSIDEVNARGELIEGNGEGIYYPLDDLKEAGIEGELKLGDEVSITWSKENYKNENWEEFKAYRK